MLALIRDVLSYSELSREAVVFEPVDLQGIVDGIRSDFELLIGQKNAESITAICRSIGKPIPLQMSRNSSGTCSNALKFARKDKPPVISITAVLTATETATHLEPGITYYDIQVMDNGIGFRQIHAEQIFSIFQRLHIKTEYPGTGIGLAMCKKIAENHRGIIYAVGNIVNGDVFHILLPGESRPS